MYETRATGAKRLEAVRDRARRAPRDSHFLWLSLALAGTAFLGFWFTYFGPLFHGAYPRVTPIVHVHGWTFFAWYLLLPAQAGLVRAGRVQTHRVVGLASAVLGVLMIAVGLIVSVVQIDRALGSPPAVFWNLMGLPIFSIWMLFTVFYVAAMIGRRRPADHKRLMLLASSVALAAATFRIVVEVFGFNPAAAIAGCLAPLLFVLASMVYDWRRRHRIHRIFLWGAPVMGGVVGLAFVLAMTPWGDGVKQALGGLGRALLPLYRVAS